MEDLGIVNLSMLLFVIVHWQTVADRTTNGRGLSLESLDTRYATRDLAENRNTLQQQLSKDVEAKGLLAASEGTPIGTAAEQRKALKHQEQQVGSTQAFMLFVNKDGRRQ